MKKFYLIPIILSVVLDSTCYGGVTDPTNSTLIEKLKTYRTNNQSQAKKPKEYSSTLSVVNEEPKGAYLIKLASENLEKILEIRRSMLDLVIKAKNGPQDSETLNLLDKNYKDYLAQFDDIAASLPKLDLGLTNIEVNGLAVLQRMLVILDLATKAK